MALVIETGEGLPDAQSYTGADWLRAYAAVRGLSVGGIDTPEAEIEAALVRATTWLDAAYSWPGKRKRGRAQALQWPRIDATDADGVVLPDDEIPAEIYSALCEGAVRELASQGILSPDVIPNKIIASARVSDAVSVSYRASQGLDGVRPILTVIDDILATLIGRRASSGNVAFGSTGRA